MTNDDDEILHHRAREINDNGVNDNVNDNEHEHEHEHEHEMNVKKEEGVDRYDATAAQASAVYEMERLLALQEELEQQQQQQQDNGDNVDNDNINDNINDNDDEIQNDAFFFNNDNHNANNRTASIFNFSKKKSILKSNYTTISILLTILHILYVLRTRKQLYLALMYLTTSRLSYILFGNAIIASSISLYSLLIKFFLHKLRMMETESIAENLRWNITESVFALTMFREEVTLQLMGLFLVIVWTKCLHWACELRGSHLRMTQEAFYLVEDEEEENMGMDMDMGMGMGMGMGMDMNHMGMNHMGMNANANHTHPSTPSTSTTTHPSSSSSTSFISSMVTKHIPQSIKNHYNLIPRIHTQHIKYYIFMNLLYSIDICIIAYCSNELLIHGPSANILFLFEACIMLITVLNSHFLYSLHCMDGLVNVLQRIVIVLDEIRDDVVVKVVEEEEENEVGEEPATATNAHTHTTQQQQQQQQQQHSRRRIVIGRISSKWRDHRATANFSIELMSLSAKFLLHLTLFFTVFATYGLPISIIRDFYMAYLRLRQRLSSFVSYRRLTYNMDGRFETITTDEELEDLGKVCIICRDGMDVQGVNGVVKKLPLCGHAFHKHCLREWLVQQQSCPTCRADIQANEARARRIVEVVEEEEEEEEEEVVEEENYNGNTIDKVSEEKVTSLPVTTSSKTKQNDKDDDDTALKVFDYPILYRVNKTVQIANFVTTTKSNDHNDSNIYHQTIARDMDEGTIVVCTERRQWVWNNDDDNDSKEDANNNTTTCCNTNTANCASSGSGVFLKIPDGWIKANDLTKLLILNGNK